MVKGKADCERMGVMSTRRMLIISFALVAMLFCAVAANADTIYSSPQTLAFLSDPVNDACMAIGDKKFCGFGYSVSGTLDATLVNVSTVNNTVGPDFLYGLRFQGPISSTTVSDLALSYTVTTTDSLHLISDIHQWFNLSSTGNGGTVAIGETAFGANNGGVAQSSIGFNVTGDYIDPPAEHSKGMFSTWYLLIKRCLFIRIFS